MADGLSEMMGRHDFRNLCKMNCEQVYNFERVMVKGKVVSPQTVYSVSEGSIVIEDQQDSIPCSSRDMCHVEICGQAFLWHQIRCIISILSLVGCGKRECLGTARLLFCKSDSRKISEESLGREKYWKRGGKSMHWVQRGHATYLQP